MLPLMINIESDEFYETIMELKAIFNSKMRKQMGIKGTKLIDKFVADKEFISRMDVLIEKDPESVRKLAVKVDKYVTRLKEMRIRDWVVRDRGYGRVRTIWRSLSLLLTLPIFLAGFITSAIPYLLPGYLVRNVKDLQFHSSLKAGLGFLLLFPLVYVLETLAFGLITGFPWWAWIMFLLALLPVGQLALIWYLRLKKTIRGAWFRRQLLRNKPEALQIVGLRKTVLEETARLVGKKVITLSKGPGYHPAAGALSWWAGRHHDLFLYRSRPSFPVSGAPPVK